MNPKLKAALSVVFVLLVSFFAARFFWHPKEGAPKPPAKRIVVAKKKKAPAAPKKTEAKAQMAIILDDWGLNLGLIEDARAVGRPLTLSVLPHLAHSREIAEEASAHGLGVMLHMPMQPKSKRQPLEPKTIKTDTPDLDIIRYLDEALASVPHVEGVNNHQGSAATSDARVMGTVLKHLKKKGLFFIDSQVISTSVGARMAHETGVPFTKRDVFIDNTPTLEAVTAQLRSAEKIALARGRVIVIGHDKQVTLDAIKAIVPELEKNGVELVLAKDLLE